MMRQIVSILVLGVCVSASSSAPRLRRPADMSIGRLLVVAAEAPTTIAAFAREELSRREPAQVAAALRPWLRAGSAKRRRFALTELSRRDPMTTYAVALSLAVYDPDRPTRRLALEVATRVDRETTIDYLIARYEGGVSPRSFVYTGRQMAFVQDFDVEVA